MSAGTLESELFGSSDEDDEGDGSSDERILANSDDSDDDEWVAVEDQPAAAPAEREPEESEQQGGRQDHVEEDGYVPENPINYRRPRDPFLGMSWEGLRNAFIRTDSRNSSLPRGTRPCGYIWVPSINGYRRTLEQTRLDEARLDEAERQRQRPRGTRTETLFGSDVINNSLLELTWYVSALGHHVPREWFGRLFAAWKCAIQSCPDDANCQVMMAYEKGERKELGHLQGITRILTHESLLVRIRAWMKAALLTNTGAYRSKVSVAFFTGQTWDFMGGYVQKDKGKPHYMFEMWPPLPESKSCCCLCFSRMF